MTELDPDRFQLAAAQTFLGMLKALGANEDGSRNFHVLVDFHAKLRENVKVWNLDNPEIKAVCRECATFLKEAFESWFEPGEYLEDEVLTVQVLVVRDPDASNEFTVDAPPGVTVITHDMDLGREFDINQIGGDASGRRSELLEFVESWLETANTVDPLSEVRIRIDETIREVMNRAGFTDAEIGTAFACPNDQITTLLADPKDE